MHAMSAKHDPAASRLTSDFLIRRTPYPQHRLLKQEDGLAQPAER